MEKILPKSFSIFGCYLKKSRRFAPSKIIQFKAKKPKIKIQCGVEQLVARWAHNPKVVSSSLAPATEADKGVETLLCSSINPPELFENCLKKAKTEFTFAVR